MKIGPRSVWSKRCATVLTKVLGLQGVADAMSKSGRSVLWKSAREKGVGNRTKELMGRVGMLRVSRARNGALVANPGLKTVTLLIDRSRSEAHINHLCEAGVDEIFYSDELNKLVAFLI